MGVKLDISPPVTKKKAPKEDMINPITLILLNFSLNRNKAKMEIKSGESKQTNKAGNDGPIRFIARY